MSELLFTIGNLEEKLQHVLSLLERKEKQIHSLEEQLSEAQNVIMSKQNELNQWEERYHASKMALAVQGNKNNNTKAKLTINNLIREVDHCISQLSEMTGR